MYIGNYAPGIDYKDAASWKTEWPNHPISAGDGLIGVGK
jgi:hypothetical protein